MLRLLPELMAPLDAFATEEADRSRPEALRVILKDWLISHGYLPADGET